MARLDGAVVGDSYHGQRVGRVASVRLKSNGHCESRSRPPSGIPMTRYLARSARLGLLWLVTLAAGCINLGGVIGWSSPEIVARVVTPDGAPVAGAIVVANWNIEGPWNGASLGQLAIAEVVTDHNGTFRIPAWGPRSIPKGHIRIDEPTVRIFKPGFMPLIIKNYEGVPMKAADYSIAFRLQNQTIELTPFKGSLVEYESKLNRLLDSLNVLLRGGVAAEGCNWRHIPRLLLSLENLKIELAEHGAGKALSYAYQYGGTDRSVCGDAKQFFMGYRSE